MHVIVHGSEQYINNNNNIIYILLFAYYRRSGNFRVKNILCVKISWRKIFVRPIVYETFLTGVKLRWRLSNELCVRGYHVYQRIWTAAVGEVLHCEREPTNSGDRYAVAVKYSCVKFS